MRFAEEPRENPDRVVYRCVRCGQPRRTVVLDLDSNKWTDVYCLPCVEEMKEKDDESDS